MDYGLYRPSRFMVELNRNSVLPGDFHRYILLQNAYVNAPEIAEMVGENTGGDEFLDGEGALIAMNAVLHEATHLLQDLSLGSELQRDILVDVIDGMALNLTKERQSNLQTAQFPLQSQLEQHPEYGKHYLAYVNGYNEIYQNGMVIPLRNPGAVRVIRLTTVDLLEAYAAARSYRFMTTFPHSYPHINRSFFNKNMDRRYNKVWTLFRYYCAFEDRDYRGETMTYNLGLDVVSFLLLCDIALHIPPVPWEKFEENKEDSLPACYLPYERFFLALETLHRNDGFPDAVDGTDFYITLYNFLAEDNQWPTFEAVQNDWLELLRYRMQKMAFTTSDHYRFSVGIFKRNHPNDVLFAHPAKIFSICQLPVLIRYYEGKNSFFEWMDFKETPFYSVMDNDPNALTRDPYDIMTSYYNPWTFETAQSAFRQYGFSNVKSFPLTFLREIFCRIISKEFWSTAVDKKKKYFCCPLIELSCKDAKETCSCISDFSRLPQRCCVRVWLSDYRINPNIIGWRNET